MPVPQTAGQQLNVKLVHTTKQQSGDEPLQIVFSVTDNLGQEMADIANIPNVLDLYEWCATNGFLGAPGRRIAAVRRSA